MDDAGAIAAVDPGRSKCGLVCTDSSRRMLIVARIVSPEECLATSARWHATGTLTTVVLGNGTSNRQWQQRLQQLGLDLQPIDEWGSTLAARQRYWELWPARGWRRLLPQGLRQPPRDLDDLAAQILLERWLGVSLARGPQTLGA